MYRNCKKGAFLGPGGVNSSGRLITRGPEGSIPDLQWEFELDPPGCYCDRAGLVKKRQKRGTMPRFEGSGCSGGPPGTGGATFRCYLPTFRAKLGAKKPPKWPWESKWPFISSKLHCKLTKRAVFKGGDRKKQPFWASEPPKSSFWRVLGPRFGVGTPN